MSSAPTQLSGDSTSKSKQEIGSTNKCEDEQVSSGASSENVGESTQEQADTTSSENMNPSKPPPEDVKTSDVLDEIIYLIPKAKAQLTDEWVYIIDSGGQPAFQELLPLFTRAASLNVVTLDISKHLDEKYPHQYQASGKLFCFDTESTYTNKKCFESSVLIGIFNQKPLHLEGVTTESPEHTMYFVFGTHYDEFEKMHAGNVESKLIELNDNLVVSLPTSIIKKCHL